jgi:putative nucleotidyltransferase with HDIG domain
MTGKRSKRPANPRPTLRLAILSLVTLATLAVLLYTVYGVRPPLTLQVGEPSPVTYRSPIDIEVVDPIATERERRAARSQIDPIMTSDPQLQRLVINAVTAAGLPAEVQELIVNAYRRPEGVSEEEIPELIDAAAALADPARELETRLLLERRLLATSVPNARLTEAARDAAAAAVRPVMQRLQAGQVIVREGEAISEDQLRVLEAVGLYSPRAEEASRRLWVALGCTLLALLLTLPLLYGYQRLRLQVSAEQVVFLTVLTLLALTAQRFAQLVDPGFLFIALIPLLVAVLVAETAAIAWAVWLAVVLAIFTPNAPVVTLVTALGGGIISSLLAMLFKTRASLLAAGALGALAAGLGFSTYHLIAGTFGSQAMLVSLAWVIGGGALAGIMALGLLPLAESSFSFLTDFRLLELSSPSTPLLQKLLLEAPGSYQHSLIISNLVEQAVSNIGGNALLARVGALYHDVGKLKRPQFFVENQFSGENPHDQLSPHLSYLIITSHVKDGLELLREHKLPKVLEPFVLEHHGTTVLTYFYKRALEDSSRIDELSFRYPGPRPRSKETAVLLLADAVEAATRTLSEPSQGSIRAMIDRLFEERLQDGQLAESPLNFHDLDVIANTFERMLTAILHRRIRYPSAEEIQGLKRGGDPRRNQPVSQAAS